MTREEMYEFISNINSPFDTIQNQINKDVEDKVLQLYDNKDLDKYDLSKMEPKMTYEWIICQYLENGKLYYIDDAIVEEVEPVCIFKYNEDYEPVGDDGKEMTVEESHKYIDMYPICGEADDMSAYMHFKFVEKDE